MLHRKDFFKDRRGYNYRVLILNSSPQGPVNSEHFKLKILIVLLYDMVINLAQSFLFEN